MGLAETVLRVRATSGLMCAAGDGCCQGNIREKRRDLHRYMENDDMTRVTSRLTTCSSCIPVHVLTFLLPASRVPPPPPRTCIPACFLTHLPRPHPHPHPSISSSCLNSPQSLTCSDVNSASTTRVFSSADTMERPAEEEAGSKATHMHMMTWMTYT